jgi:hypothetical protein
MPGPRATGESIRREMLGPCFHGIAHLLSDPVHGERHVLAFNQPVVEPGRPRRRHLAIEVDVGPVGGHEGRSGIVRATEPTHLDDAAGGASAKASIPRKPTWWARPSAPSITA